MTDIRTIFNYMGNKSSIAEFIINAFPQHRKYVEVFGGTMAILLNKPKAEVEIYNDFNRNLTNLHEVIRTRYPEFVEQVNRLYISENTYDDFYKEFWIDGNEMESAIRYFYIMCLCHLGKFTGGFKVIPEVSYVETFERKVTVITDIHKRIKNIVILNKSFEKVITANNTDDTFLYLDPPYVSSESYYQKLAGGFDESKHIILRDLLLKHKGTFMLSYEENDLVRDLYSDFNILSKSKFRQSKGKDVEEIIVTNYQPQNTLFSLEKSKSLF